MSLTNEKEKLLKLVSENQEQYDMLGSKDETCDSAVSCYKAYNESIHMDDALMEYNSSDIAEVRNNLNKMWGSSPAKKKIIPVVLSGVMNSTKGEDGVLAPVEAHNYMM